MLIRKEEPKDYEIVYSVVKDAFDSAEHSDGNEQDLVNALRKGESFIPELSLVTEINGKIVGHVMFTRATVGRDAVLVLAPLSVVPKYQRKGVGRKIIEFLENDEYAKRANRIEIHAAMSAIPFYRKLGYEHKNGQLIYRLVFLRGVGRRIRKSKSRESQP